MDLPSAALKLARVAALIIRFLRRIMVRLVARAVVRLLFCPRPVVSLSRHGNIFLGKKTLRTGQ